MNLRHSLLLSAALTFLSCGGDNPSSSDNSGVRHKGDNHYGSYETLEGRTNNNGNLTIISDITRESFEVRTLDENNRGIPLDLRFYDDDRGNVIVSSFDKNSIYLPGIYFNASNNLANLNSLIDILSLFRDVKHFVKTYDSPYNKDHLLNIPGILYEGDWSFNQAKDFVEILTKSSFVIVPVFPQAAPVFAAVGVAWGITTTIDELIDCMNEEAGLNIDKDRKYEFYSIPTLNLIFFLPSISSNLTRDIKDYYRLNQGDWWIYTDDYGREITIEVDGFKKINGNDTPVMRASDGSESYRRFDGAFLKVFGEAIHNDQQNIDFVYAPPIKIGDDRLDIGRIYPNSFRETNHDLDLRLDIIWDGVENLTMPESVFNDCWRAKEVSDNGTITRWYYGGVGQVQVEYQGYKIRLIDYGSGGLSQENASSFNKDMAKILFGMQVR